jgi:hypothetical protein
MAEKQTCNKNDEYAERSSEREQHAESRYYRVVSAMI